MLDRDFIGSVLRFGLVGGAITAAVYLLFVSLVHAGVDYRLASTAGWALGVAMGYLLNKRITFRLRSGATVREVAAFLAGYGVQLALGLLGYTILIGRLHLDPTPAFVLNTAFTAAFT